MPNKIEIEPSTPFNAGWLGYVLGLDAPDPDQSPEAHDGWKMGEATTDLKAIRKVFLPTAARGNEDEAPAFRITLLIDTTGAVMVGEETTEPAVPVRTTKLTKESGRE